MPWLRDKLLLNWHFAMENNFFFVHHTRHQLVRKNKNILFGIFWYHDCIAYQKNPISLIMVILSPKEKFPYANVPEDSHRHSQEV